MTDETFNKIQKQTGGVIHVPATSVTPLLRRLLEAETESDNGRSLLDEEIKWQTILSDEGRKLSEQIARMLPLSCPECGFQNPGHTFDALLVVGCLVCKSCSYVLQEKDFWPGEITAANLQS